MQTGTGVVDYVYDDGGRRKAGFRKPAGDCFVRSLAIATSLPYRKVYRKVAREFKRYGYPETSDGHILDKYTHIIDPSPGDIQERLMGIFGFERIPMKRQGRRPSFSQAYGRYGDCIVDIREHTAAIVEGDYRDTWNWKDEYWDGTPRPTEPKAMAVWVRS